MKNFKHINIIFGWVTFIVALVVYTLTLEKSVSLWDCGEFISASDKLQVVHPPGAPLFLMLGRFFAIFAEAGTNQVAIAVNLLSAVASAATVMLTFWITTHLAKKTLNIGLKETSINLGNTIALVGAGLVAAFSVTFLDTFWFSAVEAEVYAASSCFMALAFWGIMKWETVKDNPTSNRWLIFISYVVGLGIGLHLLNLLVVPAIILYYFLNKYEVNRRNVMKASAIGLGAIALLQYIIIPKTPVVAAFFDRMFVNGFGLPFNSGVLFFMLLVGGAIAYGLIYTKRKQKVIWNTIILCFAYIMLGFSTYAMVVIRSIAEPAIDMNDPEDAESLLSYINREQYGERPLFYGPYWNVQDYRASTGNRYGLEVEEGRTQYRRGDGRYEEIGNKPEYKWDDSYSTIFPRMGDMSEKSNFYRKWCGMDRIQQRIDMLEANQRSNPGNEDLQKELTALKIQKPTFGNNLTFLFNYQIRWMYVRYFMWNFVGRQNDRQNVDANLLDGNWLSGINFIDENWLGLGPQDNLPDSIGYHKSRNTYFFLPLLLGLLGMIIQFKRSKNDFYTVLVMFIFTGLLVVIYLNQPPLEPRERDYTFAGSFQTFCIWIGLSVVAIVDLLKKYANRTVLASVGTVVALLGAPVLLATENWDDHNRDDRELGMSFAKNYLNSCGQNAILFTNGDNDTYPLWYAQNVEGYRTDVRIINLSLLPTEWYSRALRRKVYDSEPLPMSIPEDKLVKGTRDYLQFYDTRRFDQSNFYNLDEVLDYITSDDPAKKVQTQGGSVNIVPVKNFKVKVDKEAVLNAGIVPVQDTANILDALEWNIGRNNLSKGDIVVLDVIASNAKEGWKRPIHWTTTTGSSVYLNLDKYLRHTGLTYQLLPVPSTRGIRGMDDKELLYDKLMNVYEWGRMEEGELFLDEKAQLVPRNLRSLFVQVADFYSRDGDHEKAVALLDRCYEAMPESILPLDLRLKGFTADIYFKAGEKEKAERILEEMTLEAEARVKHFTRFKGSLASKVAYYLMEDLTVLRNAPGMAQQHGLTEKSEEYSAKFAPYQRLFDDLSKRYR